MDVDRNLTLSGVLGVLGGWFGYLLGSGIEETWQGALLGIFLCVFSVVVFIYHFSVLPQTRFNELLLASFAGLATEGLGLQSIYLAMVIGGLVAISVTFTIQNLKPYSAGIRSRVAPRGIGLVGILLIIVFLAWSYPKGLLKDALLISTLFLIFFSLLIFGSYR
jgi:hypothetical protein